MNIILHSLLNFNGSEFSPSPILAARVAGRLTSSPADVRGRAVRMVFEHEREYDSRRAAISSISAKLGMTAETLRK